MYTSSTVALAALEVLVHLDVSELPDDFVAIPADVPESLAIARVSPKELPANWRAYPAPQALADVGTRWAQEAKTAVLAIPSAIIPLEENYLLNPLHAAFRQIQIGKPEPFRFDARLFKA